MGAGAQQVEKRMAFEIDLTGKTALVTGAGRGIGRAIATALATAGADVIGVARTGVDLDSLGSEIGGWSGQFLAVRADLSDVDRIPDVINEAWGWKDRIDIAVNAAGTITRLEPLAVTPEQWSTTFDLNARATFFVTQAVGRKMLATDGGSIVMISSIAGEVVTRAPVVYQASKAAVIQLTRALSVSWAPTVRVNAVGPGYIRTSLNTEWLDREENRNYVLGNTPMGRVGEPADVVGAVLFLASDASGFITGQHLRVDGGWSAR
jgi:NAD(P)-dependent dehydrogenase (short-subunit alcohol dehydrogenase family)